MNKKIYYKNKSYFKLLKSNSGHLCVVLLLAQKICNVTYTTGNTLWNCFYKAQEATLTAAASDPVTGHSC